MTIQEFNNEKKAIQQQLNDIVEQLNSLQKVGIENAEGVAELHESISLAADRVSSAQSQFRMLLRAQYMPEQEEQACEWPDDQDQEDVCYEQEEPQPQVEPDPAVQQNALLQNLITGVTALAGAYTIFKSMKK